jgi:hypothetical protein
VPELVRVTFDVAATTNAGSDGRIVVTPEVDGESLVTLVAQFEERNGFRPSGGYSGLVPRWFNYGDLRSYFLGTATRQWPSPDRLWLLSCDCGEAGCWPFEARVIALHDTVTWTDFRQRHRGEWNYAGLGPFTFDRSQYQRAVAWMVEQLEVH